MKNFKCSGNVIVPRSECFSQIAEYQIEQYSPKLRVLDSSSSLEYKIIHMLQITFSSTINTLNLGAKRTKPGCDFDVNFRF